MGAPNELSFLPDDYLERKARRRANAICAVLFFIVRLVRDRRVMGRYANGPILNGLSWTVVGAVAVLSLVSIAALAGLLGG